MVFNVLNLIIEKSRPFNPTQGCWKKIGPRELHLIATNINGEIAITIKRTKEPIDTSNRRFVKDKP